MRKSTLLSAALILAPAVAFAAGTNVISAVEVAEAGAASTVTIRGAKPPSFTTFSLVDPPRFVVDLAEAGFEGVKRKVSGAGVVKEVNAISFGEGTHATARITVTFVGDVDPPDVMVSGNQLVVRVRAPAGSVTAAAPAPAPEVAAPAAAAPAAAAPAAAAAVEPAPVAAPVAAPVVVAAAATSPVAASAAADAKAAEDARAAAESRAAIQAQAAAEAQAAAKAKVAAEARAAADAKIAADAKAAAEARAAAEAKAVAEARAAEEARAARRAQVEAEAEARAAADARAAAAAEARTAAVAVPPPATKPAPAQMQPESARNEVEFVGFKQTPTGSRVFVRLRTTPRFSVSEPRENLVRVEFPNTRVPLRNDLKALDTSFFPTAVAKVTPVRQGRNYVLEIQLRESVAWQQRIEGATLSLDFDRPTTPPAPAAPAK